MVPLRLDVFLSLHLDPYSSLPLRLDGHPRGPTPDHISQALSRLSNERVHLDSLY